MWYFGSMRPADFARARRDVLDQPGGCSIVNQMTSKSWCSYSVSSPPSRRQAECARRRPRPRRPGLGRLLAVAEPAYADDAAVLPRRARDLGAHRALECRERLGLARGARARKTGCGIQIAYGYWGAIVLKKPPICLAVQPDLARLEERVRPGLHVLQQPSRPGGGRCWAGAPCPGTRARRSRPLPGPARRRPLGSRRPSMSPAGPPPTMHVLRGRGHGVASHILGDIRRSSGPASPRPMPHPGARDVTRGHAGHLVSACGVPALRHWGRSPARHVHSVTHRGGRARTLQRSPARDVAGRFRLVRGATSALARPRSAGVGGA